MQGVYRNPFKLENEWDGNQLGDPFIMRYDGWYYLYCSSHRMQVKCWKSEDLVNFEYIGSVCDLPEIDGAYAPEVCFYNGKFYMITSPKGSGHYLLRADAPEGPFSLVSENFGLMIDGSLFVDDDGKEYLLRAGHDGIVIHDMPKPEFPKIDGTTIPQSWLKHWTEGPMLIKRRGRYFLTYTGNHLISRGYRIAYSVSETSPKGGYINPRYNTILLEVGDEFHALGHSSSVLGPDMDSYYIAYHSFDFRTDKPFRSLNIDRLFFNESRMYTNATWWEQKAPLMPVFRCRNGEGLGRALIDSKEYLVTPKIEGPFSAEININPDNRRIITGAGIGGKAYVLFGINSDRTCYLYHGSGSLLNVISQGKLPEAVCLNANVTVRISYASDNSMHIWVNGMHCMECKVELDSGSLGIWSESGQKPGFVGYSSTSDGEYDCAAHKSVPGRFDAVHSLGSGFESECFTDRGMQIKGVRCKKDTSLNYSLNVKGKGRYSVFCRIKGLDDDFGMDTSAGRLYGCSSGVKDSDGFEIINLGVIDLNAGFQTLKMDSPSKNVLLDFFEIVPFDEVTEMNIIENGQNVNPDLRILGHKREKSMLHKYSGFTCAENHGMAFIGENGWTDYVVDAVVNIHPNTNGNVSVFLRATKESWFHAQVASSLFGYRVKVDAKGVSLSRCNYDETELAYCRLSAGEPCKVKLSIAVRGPEISIVINDRQTLSYIDPEQFGHGKVGMECMWEGYGFDSFCIRQS